MVVLVAGGCGRSETRGATSTFIPAELPRPTTTTVAPAVATTASTIPAAAAALAGIDGEIVLTGAQGMAMVSASGTLLGQYALESSVRQPTWSRDGAALIASVVGATATGADVLVVDAATHDSSVVGAVRAYFFFSWSHDGSLVAALGSDGQGTVLDLLDADGHLLVDSLVSGRSVFVAWSPGGNALLVHRDDQLLHFSDVLASPEPTQLGSPGQAFLAAAWVPGTSEAVYVDGGTLVRADLLTGDVVDLGPVRGGTEVAVHPSGERAVIAQAGDPEEPDAARIESVDLATGARTPITTMNGFWLEWSPDGDLLLFASADDQAVTWNLWDGASVERLTEFVPSQDFFNGYILFSPAYTESPRLWSPDGEAIVFGARVEGGNGVVILPLDDRSQLLLVGPSVGFFSPGAPG